MLWSNIWVFGSNFSYWFNMFLFSLSSLECAHFTTSCSFFYLTELWYSEVSLNLYNASVFSKQTSIPSSKPWLSSTDITWTWQWKKCKIWTGIEPMTFRTPVGCSNYWPAGILVASYHIVTVSLMTFYLILHTLVIELGISHFHVAFFISC